MTLFLSSALLKTQIASSEKIISFMAFSDLHLKGRFLKFRMYHNFANLFSKLLESTFYKETSKFQ